MGGADAEAVFATARAFTDTAPVDERYWAWRSGLGWIGKNTQLIIPGAGSRFFLGELFLPFAAETYDRPVESQCGTCDRCLRVCPTQALSRELGLDARKCLSYLSIEYRGETLPEGTGRKLGHMFYGCDRCTDCCPWNRLSVPTDVTEFYPLCGLGGHVTRRLARSYGRTVPRALQRFGRQAREVRGVDAKHSSGFSDPHRRGNETHARGLNVYGFITRLFLLAVFFVDFWRVFPCLGVKTRV